MLRGLTLSSDDRELMASGPWRDAKLVTPRHAVRRDWNDVAARCFSAKTGERVFVIEADDRIGDDRLELPEKYALAGKMNNTEQARRQKDLPDELELAKGMKVMVTRNLKTDLDIANGARGEIVDIILRGIIKSKHILKSLQNSRVCRSQERHLCCESVTSNLLH